MLPFFHSLTVELPVELYKNSVVELTLKYSIWFVNLHFKGTCSLNSTKTASTTRIIIIKGHSLGARLPEGTCCGYTK